MAENKKFINLDNLNRFWIGSGSAGIKKYIDDHDIAVHMLMTSAVNSASAIASSAYTEAKTTLPNKLQNGDIEVALATTAKKLSTAVGSSKKPVYVNSSGVVVESTYDLSELQSQINTKADTAITTSTVAGLAPKMGTVAAATIATQADEWVLTTTK